MSTLVTYPQPLLGEFVFNFLDSYKTKPLTGLGLVGRSAMKRLGLNKNKEI